MAIENNGELILDTSESLAFFANMIHPRLDALQLRDDFLRGLENIEVDFSNGDIVAEIPELCLPNHVSSLYDERITNKHETRTDTIVVEECLEGGLLFAPVFMAEKQKTNFVRENDNWTAVSNPYQLSIPGAA